MNDLNDMNASFDDTVVHADFADTMILEAFIDEPITRVLSRATVRATENIFSLARAANNDVWMRSRRSTQQASRDSSLRGLAAEVLGEQRAHQWLDSSDALELPLLSACLMQRARSSKPINFAAAAAACWV